MTTEAEAETKPKKETKQVTPLTLAARLAAVTADCRTITKSGRNQQQNYSYVKEADVSDKVGEAMSKHGVFCLPTVLDITEREYTTKHGTTMNLARVKVSYKFINSDKPEEFYETIHFGDGSDSGDKALYKALTGCHKYALMRTFCIGSDDDPETGHEERGAASRPAQQPKVIQSTEPQAGAGEWAYKIPFEQKDQWKGILKAGGFRWDASSKTWRGTQPLPEIEHFQVSGPAPKDEPPQQDDEDPGYQGEYV